MRYFGWYANRSRGTRKKRARTETALATGPPPPALRSRQAWAKLIAKVWLEDPLMCARCGGEMKVIAFIQTPSVVEKILRHLASETTGPVGRPTRCGRTRSPSAARAPPEPRLVPVDEDGTCLDQRVTW